MNKLLHWIRNIGPIYFLISAIIILSNDTFWFGSRGLPEMDMIKHALLVILLGVSFIKNKYQENHYLMLFVIFGVLCVFLSSLVNEGNVTGAVFVLSLLFIDSYLLVTRIEWNKFEKAFTNLVLIGTSYSIIIWVLFTLGIVTTNTYLTVAGAYAQEFGYNIFFHARNSFIFSEPGKFQIFINLAFLFETIRNKGNVKGSHIAIYGIGILTTLSTAGFISFFFVFILNSLIRGVGKKKIFYMLLILFGAIYIVNSAYYMDTVFSKFDENSVSGRARSASVVVSLYVLFHDVKNIFFGAGVNGLADIYNQYGKELYGADININGSLTNTYLNSAATFGVWFFFYFCYGFYQLSRKITQKVKSQITYFSFVVFLLLYSNEAMYYSPFTHVLVFYGLNRVTNKKAFNCV